MRVAWTIGLLLGSTLASSAAPVECAGIEPDLDRLACYDKEVGRTPTATALPAKGKWQVRSEKSAITDKTDVFMSVVSTEIIDCGFNRGGQIRLTLRCMDDATSVIFDTGCHMASSDYNNYGHVTYRTDADKAQVARMDASTNNQALGLWNGGRSIPMIKNMLGKSEMIVKMTPYSENPFTATFEIGGLDQSIKPLREACAW